MPACTHLCKVFELLCVFFISARCTESNCNFKERLSIGNETPVQNLSFGECLFEDSLCYYTQGYTDTNANNWTVLNGSAVCPGKTGAEAFSVLLSPLLNFTQNTSIMFNYSQYFPGRLSLLLVTTKKSNVIMACKESQGSFHQIVYINESIAKIAFVARMGNAHQNVTLNYVKLQAGPSTVQPIKSSYAISSSTHHTQVPPGTSEAAQDTGGNNAAIVAGVVVPVVVVAAVVVVGVCHVTTTAKSPLSSQSSNHSSTQTKNPEAAEDTGGNNAAVVAGVVVPVVVVVAVVVVGVFIWRRRRQQLHRTRKGVTSQDTTNMPFVLGAASSNLSSSNSYEKSVTAKNRSAHGVLDTSSSHYDIPRNGQPATCPIASTESPRPHARTLTSGGDEDDYNYILDENSTATTPQTVRSLNSYARVEKRNPFESNNLDADYNRMGSGEARREWRIKAGYDPVEDDYSHIAPTDTVAGVGPQTAASRRTGWNHNTDQNSTAGRGDSGRDQNTSRESEDDYSVLSAGNKQIKTLSDQRSEGAEKASGHLTSNVEVDYDRIRREDREDVLGCDYDHVGRHTQEDYDQVGQRDKAKIIGNDYDHLV